MTMIPPWKCYDNAPAVTSYEILAPALLLKRSSLYKRRKVPWMLLKSTRMMLNQSWRHQLIL